MDPQSQKVLADIILKDINDLNDDDKAFLRARRAYLTPDQEGKFHSVFEQKYDALAGNPPPDRLALYRSLQKQAKERGIKVARGASLEDLQELLK